MCLIFVGQGYPRKLFNLEHFPIYGSTLMGASSEYIKGHEEIKDVIDKADTCLGCDISIK